MHGESEPIFSALPERVLGNLRYPGSENALVWNMVYPLASPELSLTSILALNPLWGTPTLQLPEDKLIPYFWGYSVDGQFLPELKNILDEIDGPGLQSEVDLFLVGENNLILAEAKHLSTMGRCSRFSNGRCPEVHPQRFQTASACRYWEHGEQNFSRQLLFGNRPAPGGKNIPCNRHYQLGRTLLVGRALAARLKLDLHVWLLIPRSRWRAIQKPWMDFCDRVKDEALWRRMRVISWEDVQSIRGSRLP
jgi:hypothetical protein